MTCFTKIGSASFDMKMQGVTAFYPFRSCIKIVRRQPLADSQAGNRGIPIPIVSHAQSSTARSNLEMFDNESREERIVCANLHYHLVPSNRAASMALIL